MVEGLPSLEEALYLIPSAEKWNLVFFFFFKIHFGRFRAY